MLETEFYDVWKGSITLQWKMLDRRRAEITWRRHHISLSSTRVSRKACLIACEKLVDQRLPKDRPSTQAIAAVIIREGELELMRDARPKTPEPERGQERYLNDAQWHDYWRWIGIRFGGTDQQKLMALDGQQQMFQRCGVPWTPKAEAAAQKYKGIILKRVAGQKAAKKEEPQHEKQLTARERYRKARQRRAEKQTLGKVLGDSARRDQG